MNEEQEQAAKEAVAEAVRQAEAALAETWSDEAAAFDAPPPERLRLWAG
ncbi:MAG: hypothetical protein K2W96_23285 [Gemmataceae bacterium]|nr:hypothetical protein [Gemmataceae bacterium]